MLIIWRYCYRQERILHTVPLQSVCRESLQYRYSKHCTYLRNNVNSLLHNRYRYKLHARMNKNDQKSSPTERNGTDTSKS